MIIDQFTQWLDLHALSEQMAVATAKTFFEQWIVEYGSRFRSTLISLLFSDMCRLMEVAKTRTTPYCPTPMARLSATTK